MRWMFGLAFAAVASCGPMAQQNPITGMARGMIAGGGADESAGPGLADVLNREFIEAQPNDVMLVSVISREATAIVVRAGNNRSDVTWFSPDGISITLDNGVLIATRGLGADLMGADVSGTKRGFLGATNYLKTNAYLDGLDQGVTAQFQCSMSRDRTEDITIYERTYATTVFVEDCTLGEISVRNTFWRASNGVIWQARQWVSAEVGYLGYQRL